MNSLLPAFTADLDALLAPISAEHPAGEPLRYSGVYDAIKEARREDDPNLPQGIYVSDLKRADWVLVDQLCQDALQTRSKDLQLAVWLMEAWIHRYGLAGAREGLVLLRGLCEGFWPDLYPEVRDDDFDFRFAPLEWLDNQLPFALKLLPVTQPNVGDLPAYTLADREKADRMELQAQRQHKGSARPRQDAGPTRSQYLTGVTMTPVEFFQELHGLSDECLQAVEALEAVLAERCGDAFPRLNRLAEVLAQLYQHADQILAEREAEAASAGAAGDGLQRVSAYGGAPADTPAGATGGATGEASGAGGRIVIRNRAEAYRMLLEAADYLARIEPHSPTPYLVRRAVSWGSMTLIELMQEFVKDKNNLNNIFELLGLNDRH